VPSAGSKTTAGVSCHGLDRRPLRYCAYHLAVKEGIRDADLIHPLVRDSEDRGGRGLADQIVRHDMRLARGIKHGAGTLRATDESSAS